MSLERRITNMQLDVAAGQSPYTLVGAALSKDSHAIHDFFQGSLIERSGGVSADPLDSELDEAYDLKPADNPSLSLPRNLNFFDGFSYVSGHWYPIVRIIGSGLIKTPQDEELLDTHLKTLFRDGDVTTHSVRESLSIDPTGANWLEERAKIEFTEGNLALIGARKAITGARKMYEALKVA